MNQNFFYIDIFISTSLHQCIYYILEFLLLYTFYIHPPMPLPHLMPLPQFYVPPQMYVLCPSSNVYIMPLPQFYVLCPSPNAHLMPLPQWIYYAPPSMHILCPSPNVHVMSSPILCLIPLPQFYVLCPFSNVHTYSPFIPLLYGNTFLNFQNVLVFITVCVQ